MASPTRQDWGSGGSGLLRGSRTRSYGSLVQSACSPARQRLLQHRLEPGDTLAGLALKYGVTMEQIKRANRLYTNESIFLKSSLTIPVLTQPRGLLHGLDSDSEEEEEEEKAAAMGAEAASEEKGPTPALANGDSPRPTHDLSASDFFKKLDSEISLSKKAAARKLKKGESRIPREAAPGVSPSSPKTQRRQQQQRALLGPVPLTRTSRTASLRDQEDEIFKL
ncbi:lysM and putative peptidoglycan-binding domain-containing protein 1 [Tachyglossus aculeatus]|uniref:lysM and putative peptidoglycan-binding domain-containing protein 1 n=1 Tax=Tachyglossus aculeatus TaxID=9261 RepID=UPI0018F7B34B|nr:lysM and putative peptidoglycan-binding domain-containing protein 1 [Tachyglossus aculeatus]